MPLLVACTGGSSPPADSIIGPFTDTSVALTNCGSVVLLDGGSQQFCFDNAEGQRLIIVLSNKTDDPLPLTFSIESDGSGPVVLEPSSNEESDLLAVMEGWVDRNYSANDLEELGSRLDALMQDSSSAPPLSMDEQTALLIYDLHQVLATRPAVE